RERSAADQRPESLEAAARDESNRPIGDHGNAPSSKSRRFAALWITVGVLNVSTICAAIYIASSFRPPERRTQTLISPGPVERVQHEVADAAATKAPAPSETPAAPAKKLTTRDIVQRSEASVAQVNGVEGFGSGFLVGKGILVTNAHVIKHEVVRNLKAYFP